MLSIHNIFITFNEYITNSRNIESINSELIKATTASNKYLIICAFDSFNLPYHVYYLRNGCFGQDSIKVSPVNIIKNDNSQTKNTDSNSIECSLDSDTITVKVNSGELALQKIDFFSYQKSFTVIVDKDISERYSKKVKIVLPNGVFNEYSLVYYNGFKWETLSN
ncbi:MAG: hypothetical protein ACOYMA_22820 [Bacteroidia bacterium]